MTYFKNKEDDKVINFRNERKESQSTQRIVRSRSGKLARWIFLICAGLLFWLAIRVLLYTAADQGKATMTILFAGMGLPFLLSGIYTFVYREFFKKSILTFFICTGAVIVASIISVALTAH